MRKVIILSSLLVMVGPARLAAQPTYFSEFPVWSASSIRETTTIALGDVDGDGDLDLVCGDPDERSRTLYENIGGRFSDTPRWESFLQGATFSVALGDVDGDGDLDLVCGNFGDRNTLYENIGGSFSSAPMWESDSSYTTMSVALGDVDGDGDLDLVCGNGWDGGEPNVLYRNNGGTFVPAWESDLTMNTRSVALGDVDGDGNLDLVCGNYSSVDGQSNTLYRNVGGTFTSSPIWSGPMSSTAGVALGDIDGDGDLDLVCGNEGNSSHVNALYENIGGTFSPTPTWSSGLSNYTGSVALGDVDGDGDLDLVCGNLGDRNTLYVNTGGALSSTPGWSSSPENYTRMVALGDVDRNGTLDIVCANDNWRNTIYRNTSVAFAADSVWSSGEAGGAVASIALGDVSGNGNLDMVYIFHNNPAPYNAAHCARLYHNTGGVFADAPAWSICNGVFDPGLLALTLGDIDGDGDLDLVCGTSAANTLYQNIGGTYSPTPAWSSGAENATESIALGDIDGDGDLDLVCGNSLASNTLYMNTGGGLDSTPAWSSGPAGRTRSIALGDVDDDGDLDLVCGNGSAYHVEGNTLYENIGGTFAVEPAWTSGPENDTRSVALGDVDGDGDLDLACGNGSGAVVYANLGGTFATTPMWSSEPTTSGLGVALADVDGDGDLDLVCGNSSQSILYENTGGTLAAAPVLTNGEYTIALGDIDGDGDLDLVSGASGLPTLYRTTNNPVYKGDLLAPTNQLTNNGPFIGRASVAALDEDSYRVTFTVHDVESDAVRIVPEYQFAGEVQWRPADLAGGGTGVGPIEAAPEGATDSLEWDISWIPFSHRDVVFRLTSVEIPHRVGIIQHASTYLQTVGPIVPMRPEITSSTDSLMFSQVAITVGDTTSHEVILSNTGTLDLLVEEISLPSAEMRVEQTTPFTLHPGNADTMTVFLEPRLQTNIAGAITIASDDPITPSREIVVTSDIRPLDVSHELLKASDVLPLGEAVTVVVTPAPQVNVERGYLLFRAGGTSTFADSIPLSPFKGEFVAVIPGDNVTEAGLEYFIRVENSGVFGADPPGAPASFYTQAVESPTGVSSEPVPNSGADYLSGRDIKVYAVIPTGTRFLGGALHYRVGGSSDYMVDSLVLDDVFPEAAIPGSIVGACGVEYWLEVQTETARLSDPSVTPSLYPHVIPVTVQDLVEPRVHAGGEEASAYRMMSVPLQFQEEFTGTIEALLADQPAFGPYDPVKWRSWVYLPETGTYGELSEKAFAQRFHPEPGRAYWLISREDHRISTAPVSGLSTPTGKPFALELASGWNTVGAPFAFSVPWDSVCVDTVLLRDAVGVSVDPPLRWDGGYSDDVSTLEPFEGYWIYNRTDHPVTLHVPDREATPGESPTAVARGDDFRLSLQARSGDRHDSFVLIGTSSGGRRELDRLDRVKPPPAPGQGLSLYFIAQGPGGRCYRLSTDVRSGSIGGAQWGEVWALDVMSSRCKEVAGDAVTIAIDRLENLPADGKVVLVDRKLDRQIAFDGDVEYTFYLGVRDYVAAEKEARFRLIAGSESFVQEEATRLLELPTQAALHQNYPNPFNPSTVIRYDVAARGMVTIRVYSVSGALVRVLEQRERSPGRYEVGWDGANDRGEQVSSGIYFYRLTAPGYTQTRKMALVR
jgi:hypothetical protein